MAITLTDICEADFPPEHYGSTLEQIEATISDVVERVFRDGDGILRSGVNGRSMQPLTLADVDDRPDALGCYTENSAIPRRVKPIWLNYENAGQASGKYLMALCDKYRVTHDRDTRDRARRTVDAIITLWRNAAATNAFGRGFFPKPYSGIHDVSEMFECSADQYADVALGLQRYHDEIADDDERAVIREMVVSFATWWHERDYAGAYFGKAIWWKRLGYPHVVGAFLFLNALALAWSDDDMFREGFDKWMNLRDGFFASRDHQDVNGCGIALDCLERLIDLQPDHKDDWVSTARFAAGQLVERVREGNLMPFLEIRTEPRTYASHYLGTAIRVLPGEGFDDVLRECLAACDRREIFYHVVRGQTLDDPSAKLAGADYRNTFWCEGHVSWLSGYWSLRRAELG